MRNYVFTPSERSTATRFLWGTFFLWLFADAALYFVGARWELILGGLALLWSIVALVWGFKVHRRHWRNEIFNRAWMSGYNQGLRDALRITKGGLEE